MARIIRRDFLKGAFAVGIMTGLTTLLSGCKGDETNQNESLKIPPSKPDPDSEFGVDENININTIDGYLGRDDVAYRDLRMLFDPAKYSQIGGESDIADTLEGFKIVPFPYLATLSDLPVEGAYRGNSVFKVVYSGDNSIISAEPNYAESFQIIEDLFPKDRPILLVCGAGGYAASAKALLVFLGWDETKLYNIGGMWSYEGNRINELILYSNQPEKQDIYATWRADYALIDFSRLNPLD